MALSYFDPCSAYARKFTRLNRARGRALHADFIAALNARIEHDGLPLDEHRMF
jgi:hypothetical protein